MQYFMAVRCHLQDAVMLALSFDRSLATAVAARPEDDEALQRKLWLAIARHLISAAAAAPDADAVCSTIAASECKCCAVACHVACAV